MGNLTVLGGLLKPVFVYGLPVLLLILMYFNRKFGGRLIMLSIFLAIALVNVFFYFQSSKKANVAAINKFTGFYKLNKLDGKDCDNCKINLHSDLSFDIIENDKITGKGKWHLETDYEEVGLYIVIDGGPSGVNSIDDKIREISFLNRQLK